MQPVTCGLQYSSSQLNTQADSSAKLATEMDELNEWKRVSMICWNWKQKHKGKGVKHRLVHQQTWKLLQKAINDTLGRSWILIVSELTSYNHESLTQNTDILSKKMFLVYAMYCQFTEHTKTSTFIESPPRVKKKIRGYIYINTNKKQLKQKKN